MRNLLYLGLSFFILLLCGSACRKQNDLEKKISKLPPITQTGANTFGCLMDGHIWTPKGTLLGRTPCFYAIVDPTYKEGDLSIRTYRACESTREDLTINSSTVRDTGTYLINDTGSTRVIYSKHLYNSDSKDYMVDYDGIYSRKGYLKITKYDMVNGIISGEFEMSMVNKDSERSDTIKITNGRFDYKF